MRLVLDRIAKRFSKTNYTVEELFNIGTIGLIKSIDTFDIKRNIKFYTYAAKCIDNEILMFLNKNKKHCNILSLEKPLKNTYDKEILIKDILEDKRKNFVLDYKLREQKLCIDNIVEELPEREKEIIKLYYGFYERIYSQEEIAKIYNVSQSYISRIIKKALLKLKIKLTKHKVVEDRRLSKKVKTKNNYCTK